MKPEELPILADKEKALQASKTCRLLELALMSLRILVLVLVQRF